MVELVNQPTSSTNTRKSHEYNQEQDAKHMNTIQKQDVVAKHMP
jgi:hypothetical protein